MHANPVSFILLNYISAWVPPALVSFTQQSHTAIMCTGHINCSWALRRQHGVYNTTGKNTKKQVVSYVNPMIQVPEK